MIRDFESWNSVLGETSQLDELSGTKIAIEAADYLDSRILSHPRAKEPLVPALGGLPLGLEQHIEEDLESFARFQIQPLFVFSGLDLARQEDPFRQRQEGAATNASAWNLYDNQQAQDSVGKFGESTYVTPEDLFRALQAVLVRHNVDFIVAPYSAWAQLAYIERQNKVHAIAGSSEILLYECDKVITEWDFENKLFKWIKREKCIADLKKFTTGADVSEDAFVDACLLAGTHFLPTIPILDSPTRNKVLKPHGAIQLIMNGGRSGISVVVNNQDDPKLQGVKYLPKYQKARMAIKHNPIITADGKIETLHDEQLPTDAHEFVGQRLPDEMYHYLSRGLINSRILSWRAFSEIIEAPPMDGGESIDYQNLVSSKLNPLRTTTLNMLSSSLHNWFTHKDLTLKCWFSDATGSPRTATISTGAKDETKRIVESWNVKEATFQDVVSQHKSCGYLGSAVLALQDPDFVSKSSSTKDAKNPLSTTSELIYNTIWRFLAVRDYVDPNHNLTAWGKTLVTVMSGLKGKPNLEEAALTAIELVRAGVLNSDSRMFPYNGAPMRGEQKDRDFNLLISRVAGLGTLHHKPIGFTGPLSQHLLGYNSIINVVRQTVRDLIEASATQMFMGGYAKRDVDSLPALAVQLPFLLPVNCALSIAVKSYLDELFNQPDPTSAEAKAQVMETASTRYFPQSESFVGDLKTAFELWDAVYQGVKTSGNLVKESEKKVWNEANEWLSVRR